MIIPLISWSRPVSVLLIAFTFHDVRSSSAVNCIDYSFEGVKLSVRHSCIDLMSPVPLEQSFCSLSQVRFEETQVRQVGGSWSSSFY